MRLQKYLAEQAIAPSRRVAELWIKAGRVVVNNKTAELGCKVTTTDVIAVDGKVIAATNSISETLVLAYHKPLGQVCSRPTATVKNTVFDDLPKLDQGRWIAVGRLDVQTSGLLLFTQSGILAQRLMHPKYALSRLYKARVRGDIGEAVQQKLCTAITLEDGVAKFDTLQVCRSSKGVNNWLEVSLAEGRNRIVRRMLAAVDLEVSKLMRISYGSIALPRNLLPGQSMFLAKQDVNKLLKQVGLYGDIKA